MAKALLLSNDNQAGSEKSLVDVLSFRGASVHGVANMPDLMSEIQVHVREVHFSAW